MGYAITACIIAVVAIGCSRSETQESTSHQENTEDIIYRLGDSVLSVSRVEAMIPQGLGKSDSLALFQSIADDWLYTLLLEHDAQLNLGAREQIEEQVRKFRKHLLAASYRESLASQGVEGFPDEEAVKHIYDSRSNDYRLEAPMVKGVIVQISAGNPKIDNIRQWMRKPTISNIDRIEKATIGEGIRYEYFIDEWQDWRDISALIPYQFPTSDAYVATHPVMETNHNGTIYMLTITDHMASGTVMPYEKAAPLIRASLLQSREGESDRLLLQSLKKKAIASGSLKVFGNH